MKLSVSTLSPSSTQTKPKKKKEKKLSSSLPCRRPEKKKELTLVPSLSQKLRVDCKMNAPNFSINPSIMPNPAVFEASEAHGEDETRSEEGLGVLHHPRNQQDRERLNECIQRLEPDGSRRVAASSQITDFCCAKTDFGTELAIGTRTELDPAVWWQQHGINCLELQRIAVRILSQTCSSYGCNHSWSTFDQIHSKRRNPVAQKRLNDLVYVHYNLRLRERQLRRKTDNSLALDNVLLESLLEDWTVDANKQVFQDDEEIFDNVMEPAEAYENYVYETEDGSVDIRKGALEMATLADMIEPLDVQPTTDDDDLDFLDDLTE